jgi:hypothetical protein
VILAIARLAGRRSGATPASRTERPQSLSNNSVLVARFGHSV